MSDQCVPSSQSPKEPTAAVVKCCINLRRKKGVHSRTVENGTTTGPEKVTTTGPKNASGRSNAKRKKRRIGEDQRELYSRLQDVKVAHQQAKRSRPLQVKDRRREIHRQNERFRHHSLNLAIGELAELVPKTDHQGIDTKHSIVQRTGEYMEYLNNKVTAICREVGVSKSACSDSLVFNNQLTAVYNEHKENYPAARPISFSDMEGLLHNMHIDNRVYTIEEASQAKHDDNWHAEKVEKGNRKSKDKRKIKGKAMLPKKGGSRTTTVISSLNAANTVLTSPPHSQHHMLMVTPKAAAMPGYHEESEESASSYGLSMPPLSHSASTLSQLSSLSHFSALSQISDPSQVSDLSQVSSEGECEAPDIVCIEDETVGTDMGMSDCCYSSSCSYSDPSDVMPFLLPSTVISEGISHSVDGEPGCSAGRVCLGQGVIPSRDFAESKAPSAGASLIQDCTFGDGATTLIRRVMPMSSPDGDRTGDHMPMGQVLDHERLPEVVQLVSLAAADGPDDGSREKESSLAAGTSLPNNMGEGLETASADGELISNTQTTVCNQSLDRGYLFFFRVNLPNFQQTWPHLDDLSMKQLLTQAWDDLPEDARHIYVDKAQEWDSEASQEQQHTPEQ